MDKTVNYKEYLPRSFYSRDALEVAPDLLGHYLIFHHNQKLVAGKIIETEAYLGENDSASHAYRGRTPRSQIMFGPPGFLYIYLIYGIYHCLNIVTGKDGQAQAVLIRALELPDCNGPGKLCRQLNIDRRFNGHDICGNDQIWVSFDKTLVTSNQITTTSRVGIPKTCSDSFRPWRFLLTDKNSQPGKNMVK